MKKSNHPGIKALAQEADGIYTNCGKVVSQIIGYSVQPLGPKNLG